jgi:hypothetical protein
MQGRGSQYGIENGRKEAEYRSPGVEPLYPVGRPRDAGLCRSSYVSMMQATDFWDLHDLVHLRRLDGPSVGRILLERKVRSCAVVVREVADQDAVQVPFAQNENMIQALAPRRADEPFREGVLPGSRLSGFHPPPTNHRSASGPRLLRNVASTCPLETPTRSEP